MPDEKLFVVAVSALGAFGPKVDALIDAIAECWFQRGAASSVGMARISICRSWRWSLWKSCVGAVATRMRQWWGARPAETAAKLPQATDTVGLPVLV